MAIGEARLPAPGERAHLVGIGGAGMRAIAELLLADGCVVTGTDAVESAATRGLAGRGAAVRVGHDAEAARGADFVVASSAIPETNVELRQARRAGTPVLRRGELLARFLAAKRGVAVAGSHGKTTTAGLVASVLQAGGLAPSFALGGTLVAAGGAADGPAAAGVNGWRDAGRHFVAEADESDASFLWLRPDVAVVTNIDRDHLGTYGQDFGRLRAAFVEFVDRLPSAGVAVLCADDEHAAALADDVGERAVTYGFAADADVRAVGVSRGDAPGRSNMTVWRQGAARPLEVALPLPGCDNARNVLAAIAVASAEGVADAAIARGLAGFGGVKRRFETWRGRLDGKRITVVDDYGHHPAEIAGVVRTSRRLWPRRRLVMAYQPHRYTRLRDLQGEFARVLATVDELLLVEVYAAGEAPLDGVDGAALARAITREGRPAPPLVASPEAARAALLDIARDGDVLVAQGAGDIDRLADLIRDGQ